MCVGVIVCGQCTCYFICLSVDFYCRLWHIIGYDNMRLWHIISYINDLMLCCDAIYLSIDYSFTSLFYYVCMVESIALSSTFEVVTCVDVSAFKYRFPTVTDMVPIELFRFRFPV